MRTKGNWYVTGDTDWEGQPTICAETEADDSLLIAITTCGEEGCPKGEEAQANAEYIVKACNAYPKLVEAVQLALTVVYRVENFGKPDEKYSTGKKQLMEAMNKGRAILTELKEL